MKITTQNNIIYFYPESELDVFLLGKLTQKFKKTTTKFTSTTSNKNEQLDYLSVDKIAFLDFLNKV